MTSAIDDLFAAPTEQLRVNGRYKLPDPETGKMQSYQSVTNFIKAIEDNFALARWNDERLVWGMGQRPGLVALAASTGLDDVGSLRQIAGEAREAAAASEGASYGSAFHRFTERIDGREIGLGDVPDPYVEDVAAYVATMANAGLRVDASLMERTTCVPIFDTAGTFDRLLCADEPFCDRCPDGTMLIGDLKTGKNELKYGRLKASMQFALYARGTGLWDRETSSWSPKPPTCPHVAVLIHLLPGSGECTLHRIDIEIGWEACFVAAHVLATRREAKNVVKPW
jgi:hypothetical protein